MILFGAPIFSLLVFMLISWSRPVSKLSLAASRFISFVTGFLIFCLFGNIMVVADSGDASQGSIEIVFVVIALFIFFITRKEKK